MEAAIIIENLSKQYKRGGTAASYTALRDVLMQPFQKKKTNSKNNLFWALDDINLQISKGDRVGIIGSNGAGKSTLLKILSRITPPTKGRVIVEGRVASLLEVGTGFHPELTGRENIYLNGSILGLKKTEINSKLDEIIAFSGVEDFIDTPLKHYSSGMQLRLAFSVAAHLEPEILLIDEVLAVGDFEFQRKCIGKMEEISRTSGRTIVFVSHNMAAIKQLCSTGVVLQKGQISFAGDIHEAVYNYTSAFLKSVNKVTEAEYDLNQHPNKVSKGEGILAAKVFVNDKLSEQFYAGSTLRIELDYFLHTKLTDPEIGIVIKDENYEALIGLNNKHIGQKLDLESGKISKAQIIIPDLNIFMPGKYLVDLYFGDQFKFYECLYDAFQFTVVNTDVYETGVELKPEWNRIFIRNIQIKQA